MQNNIDGNYRAESKKQIKKYIKDASKCKKIELSIFNFVIEYVEENNVDVMYCCDIYNSKLDDILTNLDAKNDEIGNNYLCNAVNKGLVNLDQIAYLQPKELFPDRWKLIIDRLKLIEHKKVNMATTDIFFCFKCGKNKCSVSQAQTRSADEPMTTFVKCLVCDNGWKF